MSGLDLEHRLHQGDVRVPGRARDRAARLRRTNRNERSMRVDRGARQARLEIAQDHAARSCRGTGASSGRSRPTRWRRPSARATRRSERTCRATPRPARSYCSASSARSPSRPVAVAGRISAQQGGGVPRRLRDQVHRLHRRAHHRRSPAGSRAIRRRRRTTGPTRRRSSRPGRRRTDSVCREVRRHVAKSDAIASRRTRPTHRRARRLR